MGRFASVAFNRYPGAEDYLSLTRQIAANFKVQPENILLGNETDGAVISTAIPKSKLTANAFYLTPTDKGYDFSVYGAGVQGQVGHGLQISAAIAKLNIGKHESMGQNVYDTTKTFKVEGTDVTIKDIKGSLKGGGTFHGFLRANCQAKCNTFEK